MKYILINIPKEFRGNPIVGSFINKFDKVTAKKYFEWYMSIKDERMKILEEAVHAIPEFEYWKANLTKESLEKLQPWFENVIERRKTTEEEKSLFMNQYSNSIWMKVVKPLEWVVTDKTRSLEHDIGIYFSEVLLKNNSNLSWGQDLISKRSPDLNYPIVRGKKLSFNGYVIAHGLSLAALEGKPKDWKNLYEFWDKYAKDDAKK